MLIEWRTVRDRRHCCVDLRPLCGVEGGATDERAMVCTDCLAVLNRLMEEAW